MELYIFARFEPRPGKRSELLAAFREVLGPTRAEPGCLGIHLYESVRPPECFFIHSQWIDEPAFDNHVALTHTTSFVNTVEPLLTHPLVAVRTNRVL